MGRAIDLEVIEPSTVDDEDPVRSRPSRDRARSRRSLVTAAVVAAGVLFVTALGGAGWAALRPSRGPRHPQSPPAPTGKSQCQLVPSAEVGNRLGSTVLTVTLDNAGFCTWTASPPGRQARLQVQVYDAPDEAQAAFRNEEAQTPDRHSWTFGDGAFTAATGSHATAVAVVGDTTVIVSADGLPSQSSGIAVAQSLAADAARDAGQVRRSESTLPLP